MIRAKAEKQITDVRLVFLIPPKDLKPLINRFLDSSASSNMHRIRINRLDLLFTFVINNCLDINYFKKSSKCMADKSFI